MADINAAGELLALSNEVRRLCEIKALDDDPLVEVALELADAVQAAHQHQQPGGRISLWNCPASPGAVVLVDGELALGLDLDTGAVGHWPDRRAWQVFGRLSGGRLIPLLPGTPVRIVQESDPFFGITAGSAASSTRTSAWREQVLNRLARLQLSLPLPP
jgi:hypothetical protein